MSINVSMDMIYVLEPVLTDLDITSRVCVCVDVCGLVCLFE